MNGHDQKLKAPQGRSLGRLFSVEEANRAMVLVRRIVDDIITEYALLSDLHETIEAAQHTGRHGYGEAARERMVRAVERIQGFVGELDHVGVDLKDWTLGVVHFPCLAGGREVVLCWEAGERGVCHWHEVDSDCAERKTVESLPADEPVLAGRH